MKKRSHRYDLNRPWPRNGDKYTKYKMCLSILLFGCPTANFGPFSRVQHQYPDVNHCIFNKAILETRFIKNLSNTEG